MVGFQDGREKLEFGRGGAEPGKSVGADVAIDVAPVVTDGAHFP